MAAKVITIAQQKGGAGKTTLTAQIAAALARSGLRVAAVDIDPQGSLAAWHAIRPAEAAPLTLSQVPGWRLGNDLDRLKNDHDLILIDSPPHAETEAKTAIRAADLVLLPVQPSPMDLWAMKPTQDVARKEKVPTLIVLNRMPPRGRLSEQVMSHLAQQDTPVATSQLGSRVAYASSMMEGLGAVESEPRGSAAREILALCAEIRSMLALPSA